MLEITAKSKIELPFQELKKQAALVKDGTPALPTSYWDQADTHE